MRLPEILRQEATGGVLTVLATAALTGALAPAQHRVGLLNEGLLFLLLALLASATWGWRVGLFAAVVANLSLNFFFVPPLHTLTVQDPENIVALLLFIVVAIIGGSLLSSAQIAAAEARRRQAETQVLLSLSRAMIGRTHPEDALAALCEEVVGALRPDGAAVLSSSGGAWRVLASAGSDAAGRAPAAEERALAEQALTSNAPVMLGRTGVSAARPRRMAVRAGGRRGIEEMKRALTLVPLRVGERAFGVLRLDGRISTVFGEHPEQLLVTFAGEAALAVQRVELAAAAAHAEALREADEMKTALMTSISHDLKTPLAGIKTSVSSLLDATVRWSREDVTAFLETIDSQADRLNRVISDILDLNRIESGVVAPVFRSLSARGLLEEARRRAASSWQGREVTIDAPAALTVETDAALITQALVNLIENAAKYSTAGRAVHLRATAAGDRVEVTVADEGPGIASGDLAHVFDRFYRAAEHSGRVKGSGLGLAIVKGFVTLSGGSVRVESPRAGTRFVISLPAGVAADTGVAR
ncbi:MAG TPA: ATP-binding protein [Dehalococcoidia bacterium]|nr:ATP-binding protein [Dehalococcoidia bacterium]